MRSKSGALRDSKMTDRRRKILMAVIECIAEEGIARVVAARIAERAGVSNGLVFYYFPTTQHLLDEALVFGIAKFSQQLEEQAGASTDAADFFLRAYSNASPFGGGAERTWSGFWCECLSEANRNPAFRATFGALRAGHRKVLLSAAQRGRANGLFTNDLPAAVIADLVATFLAGLQLREILDESDMTRRHSLQLVRTVLDLLGRY